MRKSKLNVLEKMYCKHCNKEDHNTEDCWSTHAVWKEEEKLDLGKAIKDYNENKNILVKLFDKN